VVAVGGHAVAAVERIAHDGAPAEGGHRGEEGELVLLNVFEEVEEGDAGFEDRIAELGVDLDDALEPAHVERHLLIVAGLWPAVAEVLAAGERPEPGAGLGRELQERLHLFDVAGAHARPPAPARVERKGVGVAFGCLGPGDMLVADKRGRSLQKLDARVYGVHVLSFVRTHAPRARSRAPCHRRFCPRP